MKYLSVIALLLVLTSSSCIKPVTTSGAKSPSLWKVYKPVQSNILGWSINAYNESTKELVTGKNYSFQKITNDGSTQDFQEFSTDNVVKVIGFKNKNFSLTKIEAKGKIYVDKIENFEEFAPDVDFVYQGLRSDSVEINLTRNKETSLKPTEVIDALNQIGLKLDSAFTKLKLVDTLRFKKDGDYKIIIKNPTVYYMLVFANKQSTIFNEDWCLTFNDGLCANQSKIDLYPLSDKNKSRQDAVLRRYANQPGSYERITCWLEVENDESGKPQLILKNSKNNDKKYIIHKNSLNNSEWSYRGHFVTSYELGSDLYKLIKIDLDAVPIKDSNGNVGIRIKYSKLMYPESKLILK